MKCGQVERLRLDIEHWSDGAVCHSRSEHGPGWSEYTVWNMLRSFNERLAGEYMFIQLVAVAYDFDTHTEVVRRVLVTPENYREALDRNKVWN